MGNRRSPIAVEPRLECLEPRMLLSANWTFMVYIDADNNLESAGIDDVNEMETVGSTDDVNVLVQLDRVYNPPYDHSDPWSWPPPYWDDDTNDDWGDTRRGRVIQDTDTSLINSHLVSVGEVDMNLSVRLTESERWT